MGFLDFIKVDKEKQTAELLTLVKKASDLRMQIFERLIGTEVVDAQTDDLIQEYNSVMNNAYRLRRSIGHSIDNLTFDNGFSTVRIQSFFVSQKLSLQAYPPHIKAKFRLPY